MIARDRISKLSANLVLLAIGVLFVLPLLWVLFASINRTAGLRVEFPTHPTLGNFKAVLNTDTTYRPVLNGIVLCGGAALLTMVCAVLAAYPLSRFRSKFNRPFLLTVLFCTGLPITAVMVPVYGLFVQLNLIDTLGGTIMFMATASLPFAIWLTKTFMDGVPISLEEAAWVDGAGNMQALRRIVLPLMWPGIAVVLIFTFIGMWGNFFVPFMLLLSPERLPASVSIFTFFSQYGEPNYGQLAAYSLIYTMPVLLLYLLLSKKLGGAFALGGAIKGCNRAVRPARGVQVDRRSSGRRLPATLRTLLGRRFTRDTSCRAAHIAQKQPDTSVEATGWNDQVQRGGAKASRRSRRVWRESSRMASGSSSRACQYWSLSVAGRSSWKQATQARAERTRRLKVGGRVDGRLGFGQGLE